MLKVREWTKHIYFCSDCGESWKSYDRYHLWPIRVKRRTPASWERENKEKFLGWHGWQTGLGKRKGERMFGQTIHLFWDRVLIVLGPRLPVEMEPLESLSKRIKHFDCPHVGHRWYGKEEDED